MSYEFYKVIHLTGIFLIFMSIGAAVVKAKAGAAADSTKKFVGMTNGAGLLIALVAGFGLMARLGISFDGWILVKLVIWVVFGGSLVILNRKPNLVQIIAVVAVILGMTAAYFAINKPF